MEDNVVMPSGKFLTLGWKEVENALFSLAEKILTSGVTVHAVVGVLRGGWIPARIIADLLDVNVVGAIEIKFYKGIEERRERPVVTQPLLIDVKDKVVLIIDDVSDTGKSLQMAVNAIGLYGPKSILTAALYVKPWSMMEPDFYYDKSDKWIIFPWETREVIDEIIHAEYKVYPRTQEDIERIAHEISRRTGLDKTTVMKVMDMIVKNRLLPSD